MRELTRKQKRIAKKRIEKNPTLIKDLFDAHDKKEAFKKTKELNAWKVSKQRKTAIGLIVFTTILILILCL